MFSFIFPSDNVSCMFQSNLNRIPFNTALRINSVSSVNWLNGALLVVIQIKKTRKEKRHRVIVAQGKAAEEKRKGEGKVGHKTSV